MSALTLAIDALEALAWAEGPGLTRIDSGIWRPTTMEDDDLIQVKPSTVRKLLELNLVFATSSTAGVPRKVKATKTGRDLLEGRMSVMSKIDLSDSQRLALIWASLTGLHSDAQGIWAPIVHYAPVRFSYQDVRELIDLMLLDISSLTDGVPKTVEITALGKQWLKEASA